MELSTLAIWIAIVAGLIGLARRVLGAMGSSSDVMASLFVPPDRSLGWPRGVQESDEPWAWRTPDPDPSVETSTVPSVPVRRVR